LSIDNIIDEIKVKLEEIIDITGLPEALSYSLLVKN